MAGRVHSEVISIIIPKVEKKTEEPALFGLKGTNQRHGALLWLCYCVDRLLDTHNPFGDKCADRGRVEPVKVSYDVRSRGLMGLVLNMFPHHWPLISVCARSKQMEVE